MFVSSQRYYMGICHRGFGYSSENVHNKSDLNDYCRFPVIRITGNKKTLWPYDWNFGGKLKISKIDILIKLYIFKIVKVLLVLESSIGVMDYP